jgi:hypothetical protein
MSNLGTDLQYWTIFALGVVLVREVRSGSAQDDGAKLVSTKCT